MTGSLSYQVGGTHYARMPMQPNVFVAANNWDAFAQNILKYVVRWRDKGGLVDLRKAHQYALQRIELRMEHHHSLSDRHAIPMADFITSNAIVDPQLIDILMALERWVMSSGLSTSMRGDFMTRLVQYAEAVESGRIQ